MITKSMQLAESNSKCLTFCPQIMNIIIDYTHNLFTTLNKAFLISESFWVVYILYWQDEVMGTSIQEEPGRIQEWKAQVCGMLVGPGSNVLKLQQKPRMEYMKMWSC